jgi:prepilin-type processing-associated H-X9-DG protein
MIEALVILAVLAILLALLLPPTERRPTYAPRTSCANNLKQIGLSAQTYATDNNGHFAMQVSVTNGGTMELVSSGQVFPHFQIMSNELSTPKTLFCPADKQRTSATAFTNGFGDQNISYFLNVDALPDNGTNLLCSDRNLTNQPSAGGRFVVVSNGSAVGWTKEIHSQWGNLCFADGRVEGAKNGGPPTIVHLSKSVTNRLALP